MKTEGELIREVWEEQDEESGFLSYDDIWRELNREALEEQEEDELETLSNYAAFLQDLSYLLSLYGDVLKIDVCQAEDLRLDVLSNAGILCTRTINLYIQER